MKVITDIIFDEAEPLMAEQIRDIFGTAGNEIIDAMNIMALGNESLAEMAAKKSGSAGD